LAGIEEPMVPTFGGLAIIDPKVNFDSSETIAKYNLFDTKNMKTSNHSRKILEVAEKNLYVTVS
jgi:hypothetical protein